VVESENALGFRWLNIMIRLGKQPSGDLNCGDEEFFQVCTGLDATMYRRAMKLEGNRNRNFENFPIGEIQNFEKRKIRFARSRDRATFRRRVLRTFKRCLRHVGGSRASALLSLRSSLSPVLAVAYPWYTCPTPGVSRGEPQRAEGQGRHARDAHIRVRGGCSRREAPAERRKDTGSGG
jgi:hypothetical protein